MKLFIEINGIIVIRVSNKRTEGEPSQFGSNRAH